MLFLEQEGVCVNGRALDYDQAVPDIMLSKGPRCDPEQVRYFVFERSNNRDPLFLNLG